MQETRCAIHPRGKRKFESVFVAGTKKHERGDDTTERCDTPLSIEQVNANSWTTLKRRLQETSSMIVVAQETHKFQEDLAEAEQWCVSRQWQPFFVESGRLECTTAKAKGEGGLLIAIRVGISVLVGHLVCLCPPGLQR